MAKSFLGNLSTFDYKSGEWSIFKGRLTQFLKVNEVKEENKSAILITHLSDDSYRLVRNLAYPVELEALDYKKLVELLDTHFKQKQCSFSDKAKFYGAKRSSGESLGDWAARLRGLASYCNFGSALDTNLTDRFVLGLGAGPERDKLFEQNASTLEFNKALEIAERAECAREARKVLSTDDTAIKEEPVNKIYKGGSRRGGGGSGAGGARAGTRDASREAGRCSICGLKGHDKDVCRYKNYKCQKCGKEGHLKKVCNKKNQTNRVRVNNIGSDDSDSETDGSCKECHNFNIRYVTDKPLCLDIKVGDKNVTMELDSGSGVSVISNRMYSELFAHYNLTDCTIKMCLYNGHKISPLGYFQPIVEYKAQRKEIKIFVVDSNGPPLLGRDFMSTFGLILTNVYKISQDHDVNALLEQFPSLWKDELGCFNKFKVHLRLKENSVPKFFKARPIPFALKDKVELELDRLVSLGILVPVSNSRYATPIVPVLKDNNTVKIAGDFSVTLNKDLIIDKYPLPRIEEVFAKLGGGEHYSKIDLKNAYNQFCLSEDSQELTTINTPKGLFKYTRLVYGLANAPALFQKAMEVLLLGIEGVSIWLDDICLTAPTKALHIKRLAQVLSRLNEAGLRLQKDKCEFFKDNVTYLGYIIDKNGLRTNRDKVKAILNAPEPTNITEVKRFLGVVNYYRVFIPNASSIMSPLHELLRSGARWEWGARQRRAVRRVCAELASERVLAHFEPSAQLVLSVDAGPHGLGAVLSQRGSDGGERPLAYASRSLSVSERNYSQIQKEATAIIFGVKHFHQYLYGRSEPFILKTDHRPLVSIFNNKTGISITTALRLQRYAIILSAYNYTVQYISSDNNLVADYFSRAPVADTACKGDSEYDAYLSLNFLDVTDPAVLLMDLKKATCSDKIIQTVIKYTNVGWPRKIVCESIRPFFLCRNDLQYENGILMRGHKVVIPVALRERMLRELHSTHLGIVKMKCNARSRMWWPGIDEDIERCIGACDVCASVRPAPPRAAPAPWPSPAAPWERIHIDYLSIRQQTYLVVIDAYSKWLECINMQNDTTSQSLIRKLKKCFSVFGLPCTLVSDNDPKINSKEFNLFCSNNGIKYMTTPIYHPCSNGQAENSVRTCKKMLKIILSENSAQHVLREKLIGYLFEYRNTEHCTTGRSPAELMFGRKLRSRLDLILPKENESHKTMSKENECSSRAFVIGDRVWVRWYSGRKEAWKLGVISKVIGKRMYEVVVDDQSVSCIRHLDQLLECKNKGIARSIDCDEPMPSGVPPVPSSPTSTIQFSPTTSELISESDSVSTTGVDSEEPVEEETVAAPVTITSVEGSSNAAGSSSSGSDVICTEAREGVRQSVSCMPDAQAPQASARPQDSSPQLSRARSQRVRKKVDYSVFYK